jgi:hypothetical protein
VKTSVMPAARHFLVVFALSMTIPVASATAQDSRIAVGALTGPWNVTVSMVSLPFNGMKCSWNERMTMTLAQADTMLTGMMYGWQVSCSSTSTGYTATGSVTDDSRLDVTLPPLPVSGWTDRLSVVQLGFAARGVRMRFEGHLYSAGITGTARFHFNTQRLGDVEAEANWTLTPTYGGTIPMEGAPAPRVEETPAPPPAPPPVAETSAPRRGNVELVVPAAAAPSTTSSVRETRFEGFSEQGGAFGRVAPAPGGGVQFALAHWASWNDTVFLSAGQAPLPPAGRVTMVWEGSHSTDFGIAIGEEGATHVSLSTVANPFYLYVNGYSSDSFPGHPSGVDTLVVDYRDSAIAASVDGKLLMQCVARSALRGPVKVFAVPFARPIMRLVRVEPLKRPTAVPPTLDPGACMRAGETPPPRHVHVHLVVPAAAAPPSASLAAETRFTGLREQRGAFGRVAPAPGGGVQFALNDWAHWRDTVYLPAVQAPLPPAARVTMVWEDTAYNSGVFGIAIGKEGAARIWAELPGFLTVNGHYSGVLSPNRSRVDTLVIEYRDSAIAAFVDGKLLMQCVALSPVGGPVTVHARSSTSVVIRLVRVEPLKGPAAPAPTLAPGQCR